MPQHSAIVRRVMPGRIDSIFITTTSGAPMQSMATAELVAGRGIRGDRNYREVEPHEEQITFIAAEEIERFNQATGLHLGNGDPRRNVVTRGVALDALVGRRFRVGSASFSGLELCEPCATLGKRLASPPVTPAAVVAAFTHRAGLRARIDVGGTIAPGDAFAV